MVQEIQQRRLARRTMMVLNQWSGIRGSRIHYAVLNGDSVGEISNIIKADPNVLKDRELQYGFTPLHLAALRGEVAILNIVYHDDKDKSRLEDQSYLGETPLHLAAAAGRYEAIKWLIAKGAKPDAKDKLGRSPKQRAIEEGQADAVKLFDAMIPPTPKPKP